MYSRDFGGIKSEGQLYNYEREYNESRERNDYRTDDFSKEQSGDRGNGPDCARENEHTPDRERSKGLRLDFLRDLRLDDLILIGIGLLLLLDSDGENDIFVLLIAFLLLF